MRAFLVFFISVTLCCDSAFAQLPIQWKKCLGGDRADVAGCITLTNDNGFLLAGTTNSVNGDLTGVAGSPGTWLVKMDSLGNILKQAVITNIHPKKVIQTKQGDYVVTGDKTIRLDTSLQVVWQSLQEGYSLAQAQDNGFLVGTTGFETMVIVKLDGGGATLWKKSHTVGDNGNVYDIDTIGASDFLFTGYAHGGPVGMVPYIMKCNDTGGIIWQRWYAYSHQYNVGVATIHLPGGGFILTSSLHTYRLDDTGGLVWQKPYGGVDMVVTGDTINILSQPYPVYDFKLLQLDMNGDSLWAQNYGGSNHEYPTCLKKTAADGVIMCGYTSSSDGDVTGYHLDFDVWLVKFKDIRTTTAIDDTPLPDAGISVYPTITTGKFFVRTSNGQLRRVYITDISGRTIQALPVLSSKGITEFNLADCGNGMYLIHLDTNKGNEVYKIILQR